MTAMSVGKWRHKTRAKQVSRNRRRMVIKTYGTVCYHCQAECITDKRQDNDPDYLTVDHVEAKVLGGSDHIENLRPCHRRCNLHLNWLMQQGLDPATYEREVDEYT